MVHRVWSRARRPEESIEATRWLLALIALLSLLVILPGVLTTTNDTIRCAGLVSGVVLGLSWAGGYLRRCAPWAMDPVDAVALLTFALASPSPIAGVGLIMPAIWFRSMYGTAGQAILRAGVYAAAFGAAVLLWAYVPGNTGGAAAVDGLMAGEVGVVAAMFLNVLLARQLAGSIRAREQSARRDAVHMSLGSQLLSVTGAQEIRRITWTAVTGICAVTPGLRVMMVVRVGGVLQVEGATGGFARVPAALERADRLAAELDGLKGSAFTSVQDCRELDSSVGAQCVWAGVPLPSEYAQNGPAWLLLGSPRRVSPEAIASFGALANQVTLALRNGQVHEKLTSQAELDGLTGLANRASFNSALSAALDDRFSPDTTVLFVDLDDFKDVNDMLGHGAGDQLLREVAARLGRATRPGDLCARLGGDEFAVLLPATGTAAGSEVAQRIVTAVGTAVQIGDKVARVGASIGVATATSGTDRAALIHHADVAMYAAKAGGKAQIQVFVPGLLQVDSSQSAIERQLAAAAGNGELVVHYQPVLSLPDGRCTAVEALVRWQHPERGLLHPESFIASAERIGAIGDIGAFVLRQACTDSAVWRSAHPSWPIAVHVNVSGLQLADPSFIDTVTGCLSDFSLPPDQLVLEITETLTIFSPLAIDRLNTLADHGVTIAIDDFGTGYSALTTLRTLRAKIVKIDKSLVAGCTESPQDRAVIGAVVKMAAQMGMRTIAEGVETREQEEFLDGINTDAAQGYLYLRPATALALGEWLSSNLSGRSVSRPVGDVVLPFKPRRTG